MKNLLVFAAAGAAAWWLLSRTKNGSALAAQIPGAGDAAEKSADLFEKFKHKTMNDFPDAPTDDLLVDPPAVYGPAAPSDEEIETALFNVL